MLTGSARRALTRPTAAIQWPATAIGGNRDDENDDDRRPALPPPAFLRAAFGWDGTPPPGARAMSTVARARATGRHRWVSSSSTAAAAAAQQQQQQRREASDLKPPSWIPKFLLKEAIEAPDGYNRWRVPPASIAIHLCIGSVYSWSVLAGPLTNELGVVAQSAHDWALTDVTWTFSAAIVSLGLSAAIAGTWLEKVGPRMVGLTAAACWGGGFLLGSAGVATHNLPLIYAGYGALGGVGLGLGYVSPVSTLIRWFPDRRGMATGMAIMGFGGGAMIGGPLKKFLLAKYAEAPDYLGRAGDVALQTIDGARFAEVAGEMKEVVVASASDLAKSTLDVAALGLEEGVYVVGTGNTGAASTFLTLGALYASVMTLASFQYRVPKKDWAPAGWTPPVDTGPAAAASGSGSGGAAGGFSLTHAGITTKHVHIDQALKTPQFYLLWTNLCLNVTAGIGVIGVAKTMMGDIFGHYDLPAWFSYVSLIAVCNMFGRILWASGSDYLGRKNTYTAFFTLGPALYLSVPVVAGLVAAGGAGAQPVAPLLLFCGATGLVFTMYGGGFATIPAYLADVFGTKYVGGIHGRLLTAWSTAGVAGPGAITYLRQGATDDAIADLATKVDPAAFQQAFGAPLENLKQLADANTVNIARLLEIAPPGTVDPTPGLYNTTCTAMAGLLGVAFVSNLLVRPVHPKHHMPDDAPEDGEAPAGAPAAPVTVGAFRGKLWDGAQGAWVPGGGAKGFHTISCMTPARCSSSSSPPVDVDFVVRSQ